MQLRAGAHSQKGALEVSSTDNHPDQSGTERTVRDGIDKIYGSSSLPDSARDDMARRAAEGVAAGYPHRPYAGAR